MSINCNGANPSTSVKRVNRIMLNEENSDLELQGELLREPGNTGGNNGNNTDGGNNGGNGGDTDPGDEDYISPDQFTTAWNTK